MPTPVRGGVVLAHLVGEWPTDLCDPGARKTRRPVQCSKRRATGPLRVEFLCSESPMGGNVELMTRITMNPRWSGGRPRGRGVKCA